VTTATGRPRTRDRRTRPSPPLAYVPLREQPLRRLPQLVAGLVLYGFSLAALVRASLGVNPWSVLYEGVQRHTTLSFGTVSAVVGIAVLLLWIPLGQRPTLGTATNILVLAYASDLGLSVLPEHPGVPARVGLLVGGVLLNGLSVAVYVGARLGPGPRDGLMTGTAARSGRSVRLVRTLIEAVVLLAGLLLGGSVGPGTLLYASAVGPLTQLFLPRFAYRADAGRREPARRSGRRAQVTAAQRPAIRCGWPVRGPRHSPPRGRRPSSDGP
jgi:uncharacterized membrane protein YczE